MTNNTTAPPSANSLEWLVNGLLEVPGVTGSLLATQDGLKLAYTRPVEDLSKGAGAGAGKGMDDATADRVAAVISGMYSLAHGVAVLTGGSGRDLQQTVIKHRAWSLFVMSAGKGVPPGTPLGMGRHPSQIESALGVVTTPDADEAVVGYEMAQLIYRMGRHLQTPTRRTEASSADGQ
jgi:predicted regulator of Ras-like GTPase activity (Roadblock/LC7/MglB family)